MGFINKEPSIYEQGVDELSGRVNNTELWDDYGNKKATYETKAGDLQEEINAVKNDKFSYDPMADNLYLQYAQMYMQNGQRAAKNAIAESSLLTGGYGNSWAQSAGTQAYNEWMQKLNAVIPELRAAAYDEWQDERAVKLDALEDEVTLLDGDRIALEEADAAIDANMAGIKSDLVELLSEGYIKEELTEEDIYSLLSRYDDTFSDEDKAEFMELIKGNAAVYNAANNEANAAASGVMADIIAEINKNPDLATDMYVRLRLAEDGIDYDNDMVTDILDSVKREKVGDNDSELKPPTGTMQNEAAELFKEYGYDGLLRWEKKYPGYDLEVATAYAIATHPEAWKLDMSEEDKGIVTLTGTSRKSLKDRAWDVTDNGGGNLLGIDRNAKVKDQYGNEYKLIDLAREMVDSGEFETMKDAKDWLKKQKFGVKGGKLAKEEE